MKTTAFTFSFLSNADMLIAVCILLVWMAVYVVKETYNLKPE